MLITHLREAELVNAYDLIDLGDLVQFYREAKKRFDTDADFQERSRKAVVDLQSGKEEAKTAWRFLCVTSRREFNEIYNLLNVHFDEERGESFYNPFLPNVIEDLDKAGLLVEDQGAKVVFLEGFTNKGGEPLPLIVQKSDGGYNYATTDLAAIRYRIEHDHAKQIIYVTDAGQASHFAQVFQVARRAGWVPDDVELVHVPFGLVLGEDGKKFKTRSGDTVRLRDLLDEAIARARADLEARLKEEGRKETQEFIAHVAHVIGISAVKYADLSQNRTSNYIFSYDKMLNLQGNTAPYMLYAYARIQGISRKGEINFEQLGENAKVLLQHETELSLAKHLLQLSEVISDVEQDLLPNRLCDYLFQLSQKFNQFYDRDRGVPVLNAEEPQRTSRLVLCNLTARTLKLGLSLLGIPVLERM
jgi:arginyl-tRNA synthetase